MAPKILVDTGWDNGLLPNSTKPLQDIFPQDEFEIYTYEINYMSKGTMS